MKKTGGAGCDTETVRLNKYLSSNGVCSRRDADKLIDEGRVTVNGRRASMGEKVSGRDSILLNGKPVACRNKKVVLAYYKPVGVTCTERDKHADKMVTDMVKYPVRVTYAGRLDKDSEGLLLLTNDGDLIDAMMRGSNRHEKEYTVRVDKEISQDFINKMQAGIVLPELGITTRSCEAEAVGKYTFHIILTQGVNRQIRRMCGELGYQVRTIKRTRIENIQLAKLKPGEYQEIRGEELHVLYNKCGLYDRID